MSVWRDASGGAGSGRLGDKTPDFEKVTPVEGSGERWPNGPAIRCVPIYRIGMVATAQNRPFTRCESRDYSAENSSESAKNLNPRVSSLSVTLLP